MQIHVNGRDYELVTLDELTLDEAIIVYDYAKITLAEIVDLEGFHPGVVAALIHVSVARAEPRETTASLRKAIGRIPVADLDAIFADISEEVDEEIPPPSANGAATSAVDPSDASGEGSSPSTATGPADTPRLGIGSPGSATGAASDRLTSVG